MAGEICPRCRHGNGYPLPQSIPRGRRMIFVCRDCGHKWIKRNMSGGKTRGWGIYGIGFLAGVIYGLYEVFDFYKDTILGFIGKAKELFESLLNMIKGIF